MIWYGLRTSGASLAEGMLQRIGMIERVRDMPVTVKLSSHFYERFGERATNEFVDLLNQMDTGYRNELREQNEANFARFDAKLEQRIAELRAELRTEFHTGLAGIRTEMAEFRGDIRSSLERGLRVQTAWFFVAWATMFATLVALELRR
jgi:hypothetical protein